MLYARRPTDEEREELKRMTRQEVGRVSQRAHMILLSVRRKTVPEIADIWEVDCATVRFWIHRFNADGPDGLYDQERSGRPRKVTQEVKAAITEMVQDDPQKEGYLATCWTVAMLVLALANKLKVTLSPSTLRGVLHQIDLCWGRPRLGMPAQVDPEKAQKQWSIVKAVVEAPPDAAILYADESRIQLLPLIRAMWHWVGQQIRIPTPGTNVTRVLFGALNIRTGQWTYLIRKRMFKEDFIAFLEHLLVVYPSGPIILIVDNFSSHTAHLVHQWLESHPRLQLYYLPKYCSHLNPVEHIWLRLKNKIAANRLYSSMRLLLKAVATFFREMTPEQALAWAAA
ncbi:MAG: IS630 family transposase [candidate division KSB1 bacterium]|nr:IS630 family transposase [candidate division KSB1 bacterium]